MSKKAKKEQKSGKTVETDKETEKEKSSTIVVNSGDAPTDATNIKENAVPGTVWEAV